jgi:hypothetical protein
MSDDARNHEREVCASSWEIKPRLYYDAARSTNHQRRQYVGLALRAEVCSSGEERKATAERERK